MTTDPKQLQHAVITVGATSTAVLPANEQRVWCLLVNDSDEAVYVKVGVAAVLNEGIRINAEGGSLEIAPESGFHDHRAINAICASGSKTLLVTWA